MTSDDTYRAKLEQTIASVQAWSGFVADVARVEINRTDAATRIALTPRTTHACPVVIVLGADRSCRMTVGGLELGGGDLGSLDLVLPRLQAVAEGRVITRRYSSAATGLLYGTETVVTLPDGSRFADETLNPAAAGLSESDLEARETSYLPYRRGG